MAPPTDDFLRYPGDRDDALPVALLLVNVILLSAAILAYCSFCKRKTADINDKRESRRESASSELKKVTGLQESEAPKKNGTNNGAILSGDRKSRKSKKTKSQEAEPKNNGSVVKGDVQGSLALRGALPLPPLLIPPQEEEDELYDDLLDPDPNEKNPGQTSGNNCTTAEKTSSVHNPDLLENINPLYSSVPVDRKAERPENQRSEGGLPSPGPSQGDETPKEATSPSSIADEPIYSVICKDRKSVKAPKQIPKVSENLPEGPNHGKVDTPAALPNLDLPVSSSFKVNKMLKKHNKKSFKSSAPLQTVSINNDLEGPPPVPDKLFKIEIEAEHEE